jgi:hypothetical protein
VGRPRRVLRETPPSPVDAWLCTTSQSTEDFRLAWAALCTQHPFGPEGFALTPDDCGIDVAALYRGWLTGDRVDK